ncbi:Spy/CpxP family protein refolding chaperone [Xanthobacter sediminis]|uniref:Spy/CpxP family protein refolding chaperone n=1 Tax=Xanthobacter sediminis TaxID=3119926 RepID=UPI00372C3BCA
MKKVVIAAATAALIAGSAIAHAAGPADATPPQGTPPAAAQAASPAPGAAGMSSKRAAAFDAHLADLKSSLKLTADQEKLWPAFETTLRKVAQDRTAHMAERRAERQAARESGQRPARPDMVTRVRTAADRMAAVSAELRQVADALDPLYKSFDASQKRTFETTARKDLRSFFGMPHPRGERSGRGGSDRG